MRIFILISCFLLCLLSALGQTAESVTELQELVVKPKKEKYKKKGNPAYELFLDIREKAPLYNPKNIPSSAGNTDSEYSYRYYEKILLGLNDARIDPSNKHIGFLADYAAIAFNTGKPVVLLSMKEKAGEESWKKGKSRNKILSRTHAGIDDAFEQENFQKMLDDVLRPIDIFGNDIALMQQRFVSPLSRIAGDYYHFSINDTVIFPDDPRKFIELVFAPVNPESFSFNGRLYIADDSTRFIKKLTMRVPRSINLNYIDNIFVTQEFKQDSLGYRHQVLDDMAVELRILPGTPSFYGRRTVARNDFEFREKGKEIPTEGETLEQDLEIQQAYSESPVLMAPELRLIPLTEAESKLSGIHDSMRKNPFLYWAEQVIMVIAKGYLATPGNWNPGPGSRFGKIQNSNESVPYNPDLNTDKSVKSKFDFGPVNTLISYNSFEGVRLRVGGMTTGSLSSHWFGRGYAAWGFHDHKWKYLIEGEYSFRPKKIHAREFPVHSLRLTHKFDVDMLGQHYLFTNPDNVFLSLKRKESRMDIYKRSSMLEYTLELQNNFSLVAGMRHEIFHSSFFVPFIDGNGRIYNHYSQSAFFVKLRYAPGEVFYEGRTQRQPINMDAPVFQLTHEFAPKGFLGSFFTLNVSELSIQNRFWFSSFGFADLILKGGKIWSRVQFPSLLWPNANLSYTIQPESYSLMNPMEFANDWYASLDLTYWLNGLIFNRIPYVNKLKLREVFTFKLLSGGLTKKNNPAYDTSLFKFPNPTGGLDAFETSPSTRILNKTPYMEIGVGIDNILTILRVDYVWRLTYRNLPDINKSGLRISLHFSF